MKGRFNMSLDGILSSVISCLMFFGAPVMFIVFLILALVQIPKVKRKETGKAKLVTFSVLSSVFLFYTIIEVVFIIMLASAVAHM